MVDDCKKLRWSEIQLFHFLEEKELVLESCSRSSQGFDTLTQFEVTSCPRLCVL